MKFLPPQSTEKMWLGRRCVVRGAQPWVGSVSKPQMGAVREFEGDGPGSLLGRHFGIIKRSLLFGHRSEWVSFNSFFSLWHNWSLMLLRFRNNVLGELFFLCEWKEIIMSD